MPRRVERIWCPVCGEARMKVETYYFAKTYDSPEESGVTILERSCACPVDEEEIMERIFLIREARRIEADYRDRVDE